MIAGKHTCRLPANRWSCHPRTEDTAHSRRQDLDIPAVNRIPLGRYLCFNTHDFDKAFLQEIIAVISRVERHVGGVVSIRKLLWSGDKISVMLFI